MDRMLEKYSFGVGDRFAHQGKAQLEALVKAKSLGVNLVPVWNKSFREHTIVHTHPDTVRTEADAAVKAIGWKESYYVDADHINLKNVDLFLASSDFYTLDVADFSGRPADDASMKAFMKAHEKFIGKLSIPGIEAPIEITEETVASAARKYLLAIQEAGKIYRYVEEKKGKGNFITEVSIDETDLPQVPVEMLFILSAIAREGIPAQTIAPKFTGRFNKGCDYVGDVKQFEKEFNEDLSVIAFAVKEFGLPANLKLSIHSGSDKFSIYGPIGKAIRKHGAGLHLKTAGTTWLEELIGLACAEGEGLAMAKEIYRNAYGRIDELCAPYAAIIDIDRKKLPDPKEVDRWDGRQYAETLRHVQSNPAFNLNFRQLLHVGFKVAADLGDRYYQAVADNEEVIAKNVCENLLERHVKRVFV
ncbi:MAG: tagaturonate epimerase family protein [Deltaproteobacteria bacterium]|nr:tagaturonate epimerase family protein [Deltaproteobacteria bacterium]